MSIEISGGILSIDGKAAELSWPVLDAVDFGTTIVVLFDPDEFLKQERFRRAGEQGGEKIINLVGINRAGRILWSCEPPEDDDYFYRISSRAPLLLNTYSSSRCAVDWKSGVILSREFLK